MNTWLGIVLAVNHGDDVLKDDPDQDALKKQEDKRLNRGVVLVLLVLGAIVGLGLVFSIAGVGA